MITTQPALGTLPLKTYERSSESIVSDNNRSDDSCGIARSWRHLCPVLRVYLARRCLPFGLVLVLGLGLMLWLSSRPRHRGLEVLGASRIDAGSWSRSRPFEHTFLLKNRTGSPIRILGAQTRCTCTTAEVPEQIVGPGQMTSVKVAVKMFDPARDHFDEPALIRSDAGPVEVRLSGDLPPSGKVFALPSTLFVQAGGDRTSAERDLLLRVPRQCSEELDDRNAEVLNYPGGTVKITRSRPHGAYAEYTLHLKLPAVEKRIGTASLRIVTGCETVVVPIVVHAIRSPDGPVPHSEPRPSPEVSIVSPSLGRTPR